MKMCADCGQPFSVSKCAAGGFHKLARTEDEESEYEAAKRPSKKNKQPQS
jgi:hypothetical protein